MLIALIIVLFGAPSELCSIANLSHVFHHKLSLVEVCAAWISASVFRHRPESQTCVVILTGCAAESVAFSWRRKHFELRVLATTKPLVLAPWNLALPCYALIHHLTASTVGIGQVLAKRRRAAH